MHPWEMGRYTPQQYGLIVEYMAKVPPPSLGDLLGGT